MIIQKTSGRSWQCYRDEPNDNLTNSGSFKSKVKITGETPAVGNTKDVKIAAPGKCLSSFSKTLEIPLINCEIHFILTCSSASVITNSASAGAFEITDPKPYVLVITLSVQYNVKLF